MCSVESVESYYLMFQRFTLQGNVNKMYKNYSGKLASLNDFYTFCLCRLCGKAFGTVEYNCTIASYVCKLSIYVYIITHSAFFWKKFLCKYTKL